jgi:hypothetical protein
LFTRFLPLSWSGDKNGVISRTRLHRCALHAAHIHLIEKAKAMQVPSILQGESRTRLIQGIAIGAIATAVIGFSWGGWTTGGAANRLAAEQAYTAVVAALTPLCVEKFLQDSDAKANLAVLTKIRSNWEQGNYVEKGGWATQPGATSSDYDLARACAEKLVQANTAAQ